jgi:ABC-type glycerol-3-phosphate transport system substrate-binding protein
MKTKKLFWILLAALMVVSLLLTACSSTPEETAPAEEEPVATEAEQPTEEAPMEAEAVTIDVWFHSGKGEERDVLDAQVDISIVPKTKSLSTLCSYQKAPTTIK